MFKFSLYIVTMCAFFTQSNAHGMMLNPATRGSMWRFPKRYPSMKNFQNYNDMSLNAGGIGVTQRYGLPSRFGVCGDPVTTSQPRPHETGGTYGRGVIAKCYKPGSSIDITIDVTAAHRGYFQYQLCVKGKTELEKESCFSHLLKQSNGQGDKWYLNDNPAGVYRMRYDLPQGVTCNGRNVCVLRWYWKTDNSPGATVFEEFWNCADIQIGECNGSKPSVRPTSKPRPSKLPTSKPRPSFRPTKKPTPGTGSCKCRVGFGCVNHKCSNCLRGNACYSGWSRSQCENAQLTWCGA